MLWVLCFEAFYLPLAGVNPRGGLRGGSNRIFINFPGVSFNMSIHQNVPIEESGVIFWLVLFSMNVIEEGPGVRLLSLPPPLSGMCKSFVPKCPWLGKIKSCDSLAGWTLLKLFGLVIILSQFPLLHMSRNFPSFLLSCLNVPDTSILIVVVVRRMYTCVKIHRTVHTHICTCLHTHTLRLEGAP